MTTTQTTEATEPSDAVLDAIAAHLTEQPQSPSAIARRAKVTTTEAHAALGWLVSHNMAIPVGNGAWTNYRTRRFGEYAK